MVRFDDERQLEIVANQKANADNQEAILLLIIGIVVFCILFTLYTVYFID
jgi:hypothetical protein